MSNTRDFSIQKEIQVETSIGFDLTCAQAEQLITEALIARGEIPEGGKADYHWKASEGLVYRVYVNHKRVETNS